MESDANNSSSGSVSGEQGNRGQLFVCPVCWKVYKQKSTFSRYCSTKCGTVKSFKCSDCTKEFDRKDSLKPHIAKGCHGGVDKTSKCSRCSKEFQHLGTSNVI